MRGSPRFLAWELLWPPVEVGRADLWEGEGREPMSSILDLLLWGCLRDFQVRSKQRAVVYTDLDGCWPPFHLLCPVLQTVLPWEQMTGNMRQWNLELARLSVINAEEMKSVLDGNKPRLCYTQQKVIKEDGIKGGNGCSEYSLL